MQAPFPPDEQERLQVLHALNLLDSLPEPVFDSLTRLLAKVLNVPIALVSLVDERRQWFKSKVGMDASETAREVAFCAHAILLSTPLIVEDASKDDRFCDNALVTGSPNIRFYAGMPIRTTDGHALGTLCAIDAKPHVMTAEEIETLCDLAGLVSREIHFRETLLFARDQIQRSDAALIASETKFRSVFESASVGIALVAPDGRWISVNSALCQIVGYPQEELTKLTFQDITHPEDLHTDLALVHKLVAGEIRQYQMEKRYLRKDGSPVWVSLNVAKKTTPDGHLDYFISIIKDIQARKEAEGALEELRKDLERRVETRTAELMTLNQMLQTSIESQAQITEALAAREAELRVVIEDAGDAYVGMDSSGRITAWNRQAEQIFGWAAAEAVGRHLDELIIPPAMRDAHRKGMARYIATGRGWTLSQRLELPALRKNGSSITVEARIRALEAGAKRFFSAFLHDITERKHVEALREQEARHDATTGLLNRHALNELLPIAMSRADRGRRPLSLLFLDLDGFKAVNDTWGHEAGDALLKEVAERIKATIRSTDTAIRFAGDEFVVLLEGLQNENSNTLQIAEKIRESIARPIEVSHEQACVGASIGAVTYAPMSGETAAMLLKRADSLMYEAKHAGKGRTVQA